MVYANTISTIKMVIKKANFYGFDKQVGPFPGPCWDRSRGSGEENVCPYPDFRHPTVFLKIVGASFFPCLAVGLRSPTSLTAWPVYSSVCLPVGR